MKIEVTEKDILKGIPTNFFACPVALALSRATKKSIGVAWGIRDEGDKVTEASLSYPMICQGGKWTFVEFAPEVMEWINRFDRKHPVDPITFEWEVSWWMALFNAFLGFSLGYGIGVSP